MCYSYHEISSVDVKARKPHRCGWCAERIDKGEKSRYRVYVFDGEFTRDWMHPECFDALGNARHDDICDGWMPGDFERGIASQYDRDRIAYT